MRDRRRSSLTKNMRVMMVRGSVLAAIGGVILVMALQSHSVFDGFMDRHTPTVEVHAAKDLAGLPLAQDLSAHHFGWWFPWTRWRQAAAWQARYPAIASVHFESSWMQKRVIILVAPRTPIVLWNGSGFDGEGVVFPMAPGTWTALPKASFSNSISKPQVGHWLNALAHQNPIWSQVTTVSDDGHGMVKFTLQTGAQVLWGIPDVTQVGPKTDLLATVLDDAHAHLGGASTADLRFFDDGRIIVRPKSRAGQAL